MAIALGAAAVAIWIGGVASGSGWTLSFDADLGIPVLFSGGLAAVAGVLLWVAGGAPGGPAAERRAWRALAVALVLIGVEQALSLHERIDEGLGLSPAAGAAPLLALTALAIVLTLRAPRIRERRALLAGLGVWAAAGVLDALDHGGGDLAALLFLVAAPLLAVGALAVVQCTRADPGRRLPAAEAALRDLLLRLDAGRFAVVVFTALAAMLALSVLFHAEVLTLQTFDLRSQQGANQFCSFTLMFVAAGLALLRGRLSDDPWYAWTLLGLAFVAMAINDIVAGHQLIGDATGIKGQFLLFPIVVAAGVGWLGCMRLADPTMRRLFVVAAIAWVLSQAIDVSRPEGYFHWWVLPEETLELIGTTLFATGMLLAVQATAALRRDSGGVDEKESVAPEAALAGGA